jgi:hypothetical protein
MADMDVYLFVYTTLCLAIGLMGLETVDYGRWRWSLAGMLKVTLLVGVMLAFGRILASV